ncbi:S-formylglutathione hydrolase [gamma proteobacterium BDW918]|nr:S-formylglutathione hydrolase [gamma proteobacterium BDW918]
MAEIVTRSRHLCFGGEQGYYSHSSDAIGTQMNFSVFLPPQCKFEARPALYYLAGLTCSEETFMIKAGAQRVASELGLVLVSCDTSPRGLNLPGDNGSWDFGVGAGFYLNASQQPWATNYQMGSYVDDELPSLIEAQFPVSSSVRGIFGHSMGGHGSLVTALRNPQRWHSVSAFSPISNPAATNWGKKAFTNYLGENEKSWLEWDASFLIARQPFPGAILVDQGIGDEFLDSELHPHALEEAAKVSGQRLVLRRHEGYDHGYYFIQSFIEDHLRHHAKSLNSSR